MTAVFGESDRPLALLCQAAEVRESIAVPEELPFWESTGAPVIKYRERTIRRCVPEPPWAFGDNVVNA